jgi:hypothetical protein
MTLNLRWQIPPVAFSKRNIFIFLFLYAAFHFHLILNKNYFILQKCHKSIKYNWPLHPDRDKTYWSMYKVYVNAHLSKNTPLIWKGGAFPVKPIRQWKVYIYFEANTTKMSYIFYFFARSWNLKWVWVYIYKIHLMLQSDTIHYLLDKSRILCKVDQYKLVQLNASSQLNLWH